MEECLSSNSPLVSASRMPAIMMADPGSMGTNMGPRHSQANLVPGPDMRQHNQDLENLTAMLTAWNANRLDLFALSMPNEVSGNDHQ